MAVPGFLESGGFEAAVGLVAASRLPLGPSGARVVAHLAKLTGGPELLKCLKTY